jgi:cytochrome c-type biogenesis protein CcmH
VAVALASLLVIPAVALPLYLRTGSPALPDVPLQARMEKAVAEGDFAAMLAQVEQHLAANPNDLRGWQVIAPAYRRDGRYGDAAKAYAQILRLSPTDAETLALLGENLTLANEGTVTAEANRIFAEALALDPKLPMARFYAALALKQEGRAEEAERAFTDFLAETPADAPWRPMLEAELSGMSSADQQEMIRAMVEGLDQKLAAGGGDLDGWLRLIRSRMVLGETDKAKAAYEKAKAVFKDDSGAIAALEALSTEVGLK